jgi:aspartate carbamoyltransferase regulatory subunit
MRMVFFAKKVYTKRTLITPTSQSCSQCGSKLILIKTVTEKIEGTLFPQTTSTFRCSNQECQDGRDKEMEKRMALRKEKAIMDQQRSEERLQKRQREIRQKVQL